MSEEPYVMRDPTAGTSAQMRERRAPPEDLARATIGLLSISKERSAEFLDALDRQLAVRGLKTLRFSKPTHTKPAPEAVLQDIIERCDVVVEALAD